MQQHADATDGKTDHQSQFWISSSSGQFTPVEINRQRSCSSFKVEKGSCNPLQIYCHVIWLLDFEK